jgi:hypothetical protein
MDELIYDLAQHLESILDKMIVDEIANLSPFLSDFIDLAVISWHDLASTYISEVE